MCDDKSRSVDGGGCEGERDYTFLILYIRVQLFIQFANHIIDERDEFLVYMVCDNFHKTRRW